MTNAVLSDSRLHSLIDADRFELRLPDVPNAEAWGKRKQHLRTQLLLSTGLWPQPEKTPLNASILNEKQGDGFRVASVYFESLPGFLATGNLYLPPKDVSGPWPGVVCPHGHWTYGRLTNREDGSIPGRCIDFARMGFAAFAIDMVGYNDSFQMPHDPGKFRGQLSSDVPLPYEERQHYGDFDFPAADLYGLTLPGLQLWNNIRALDFLCSLPNVDADRLAVTGASGGGVQTITLMIADDRIKVAAPVNIIGAAKHPGCRCENPPGLWVDVSTIELAASFSPRPLLLPSATNDPWSSTFPDVELPLFKRYYALDGAEDHVANVHVEGGHNYNAPTRAAVCDWFAQHLGGKGTKPVAEPEPVIAELAALGDLRVFPDRLLPEGALRARAIVANWKSASEDAVSAAQPKDAAGLDAFRTEWGVALRSVLQIDVPEADGVEEVSTEESSTNGITYSRRVISRTGKGERLELESAWKGSPDTEIVAVWPEGLGGLKLPNGDAHPAVAPLVEKGLSVTRISGFASGAVAIPRKTWDSFSWPNAYNRDNRLNGVQDIVTALVGRKAGEKEITLIGLGPCGLTTLFAAAVSGLADRLIIDLDGMDPTHDADLEDRFPLGSIKRVGDIRTALLCVASRPVTLLNPSPTLDVEALMGIVGRVGLAGNLMVQSTDGAPWLPDLLDG